MLSGGGARGLAHIGVIDHLNELGYEADVVVGTSMGAVVGALYAAGYETAEIHERVLAIRWMEMFNPTPVVVGPDRAVHIPAFNVDLNLGRLRAGRGLFGQWRVNRALAALLFEANARSRGNFDLLARRYRAVAADLKTGEAVVLDTGDLARAVRASMAYPGFFAPVLWGDRVLVDGGIVDNLPVAVARSMGAQYVVGVDVSRPPRDIVSQSPLSVISRSLTLMQMNLARYRPPDALVTPVITEDFVGPSFPDDPRPLMKLGYAAAQRDLANFHPPPRHGSTVRVAPPLPTRFSALIVEAPDSALGELVKRAYADAVAGPYDLAGILAATDRLYTSGLFEAVWPRVLPAADTTAAPLLVVRVEAPPRISLNGNAHFETDRGGRAWISVDRNGRLSDLPTTYSVSGSAGNLERWAGASARVHLLTQSALAVSVGGHVLERSVRTFADEALRVKDVLRVGGWSGLEFPHILRERLFTAVARAEWIDMEDGAKGWAYGPLLRYTSVAAEARPVGVPVLFEAERRWGSLAYTRVALRGSRTVGRRGPQAALGLDVRAVSTRAPTDVRPALGDDHAIPGLRWGEIRGRARVVTGVDVAIPVQTGFLRLRARTGAVSERLDQWGSEHWVTGGQVGFFLGTPIGVIDVGYGIATRGDGRFDVSIGRNF